MSLVGIRVFEAMKTLDFAEKAFAIHSFAPMEYRAEGRCAIMREFWMTGLKPL